MSENSAKYITRGPDLAAEMRRKAMLTKFYNPFIGAKYLKLLEQINSMASSGLTEMEIRIGNYNAIVKDELETVVEYLKEDGFTVDIDPNLLWINPQYEYSDLREHKVRIRW